MILLGLCILAVTLVACWDISHRTCYSLSIGLPVFLFGFILNLIV